MNLASPRPLNIIIAGVGGQGVTHLTKSIWKASALKGLQVQGSIFKGGAQTLGSVSSMIRLFTTPRADYNNFSHQILEGDLDLLIGLEPFEALRFYPYFNIKTKILCSNQVVPLWIERHKNLEIKDPIKKLSSLGLEIISDNFQAIASNKYKTPKSAGLVIVHEAISKGLLPFEAKFFEEVYLGPQGKDRPPR